MSGVNIKLSGTKKEYESYKQQADEAFNAKEQEMARQNEKFKEEKALFIRSLGSQTQNVRKIIMRFEHIHVMQDNYKYTCAFRGLNLLINWKS